MPLPTLLLESYLTGAHSLLSTRLILVPRSGCPRWTQAEFSYVYRAMSGGVL